MPLRSNPTAWFNLPGVVAAYQPVEAPSIVMARQNIANGGSNLYRAEDGVAPTWIPVNGWTFNGTSQYLALNINVPFGYTVIAKFTNLAFNFKYVMGGLSATGVGIRAGSGTMAAGMYFSSNSGAAFMPAIVNGSLGAVYKIGSGTTKCFIDGTYVGAISGGGSGGSGNFYLGAHYNVGSPAGYAACNIQAAAIFDTELSDITIWNISRQMAYCDANPEWSAWGRRRRWFYAPAAATEYNQAASGAGTPAGAVVKQTGKRVGAF